MDSLPGFRTIGSFVMCCLLSAVAGWAALGLLAAIGEILANAGDLVVAVGIGLRRLAIEGVVLMTRYLAAYVVLAAIPAAWFVRAANRK